MRRSTTATGKGNALKSEVEEKADTCVPGHKATNPNFCSGMGVPQRKVFQKKEKAEMMDHPTCSATEGYRRISGRTQKTMQMF